MRTIVLGMAAVLVIATGLYLIWPEFVSAPGRNGAEQNAGTMPDTYDALVTYTEKGFTPSEVTIKKGQSVRWVNAATDKSETWPASAVHPTHSLYPESTPGDCLGSAFDACRGIQPGGSWQFKFNEVGQWRFHDHLHPSKTGVVIVTE